jgi:haloalkane dehalogenase
MNLSKVILVIHDWGSALGFNRAFRHQDQIAAIAYMEAVVRPFTWEISARQAKYFARFDRAQANTSFWTRTPLSKDAAGGGYRSLRDEEMDTYPAPYAEREARPPTLIWPRQASVAGEPEDVTSIVRSYSEWLSQSQIPKLFIAADPGAVITAGSANWQFC